MLNLSMFHVLKVTLHWADMTDNNTSLVDLAVKLTQDYKEGCNYNNTRHVLICSFKVCPATHSSWQRTSHSQNTRQPHGTFMAQCLKHCTLCVCDALAIFRVAYGTQAVRLCTPRHILTVLRQLKWSLTNYVNFISPSPGQQGIDQTLS